MATVSNYRQELGFTQLLLLLLLLLFAGAAVAVVVAVDCCCCCCRSAATAKWPSSQLTTGRISALRAAFMISPMSSAGFAWWLLLL